MLTNFLTWYSLRFIFYLHFKKDRYTYVHETYINDLLYLLYGGFGLRGHYSKRIYLTKFQNLVYILPNFGIPQYFTSHQTQTFSAQAF